MAKAKTKTTGKDVVSMADIEKQLAGYANESKARVREETNSKIAISGKRFSYKDEVIGTELAVIVLGFVRAADYYDKVYNPEEGTPPACFARSLDGEEMQPMPESPVKQADFCNGCPMDAYGSAATGEGKACRNSYKLAVMEAEADPHTADIAFLSLPPKSLKDWDKYVRNLAKEQERPPFAVITRFTFDEAYDFPKLEVAIDKKITDAAKLQAIMARIKDVEEQLLKAPDVSSYEPPGKTPAGGKKKAAKKKAAKKKAVNKSKFAAG